MRLAKRVRPFLGVKFGQKEYVLTVLAAVEKEVLKNPVLKSRYPWFEDGNFKTERDASTLRLTPKERVEASNTVSVFKGHIVAHIEQFLIGARSPPGDTDCEVLAFAAVRGAIVATDDLGIHILAKDFGLPIWHGWEVLAKLSAAKFVDNDLIRDIYDALERNSDMTNTWAQAKHTHFKKIFGPPK